MRIWVVTGKRSRFVQGLGALYRLGLFEDDAFFEYGGES